jgi:hypothetical protein
MTDPQTKLNDLRDLRTFYKMLLEDDKPEPFLVKALSELETEIKTLQDEMKYANRN